MKYSEKQAAVPKCRPSWNVADSNELNIGLINRCGISDLVAYHCEYLTILGCFSHNGGCRPSLQVHHARVLSCSGHVALIQCWPSFTFTLDEHTLWRPYYNIDLVSAYTTWYSQIHINQGEWFSLSIPKQFSWNFTHRPTVGLSRDAAMFLHVFQKLHHLTCRNEIRRRS